MSKTITEHNCQAQQDLCNSESEKDRYGDRDITEWHGEYGTAVDRIIRYGDEKYWWASNHEYATMIQYCPFCGIDLIENKK